MNSMYLAPTFFCVLLFPISSSAWSGKGHVVITEAAYKSLSVEIRNTIDQLVNPVFDEVLSDKLRNTLIKSYGQDNLLKVSKFAVLSAVPDVFMTYTIKDFFRRFRAAVPRNMVKYSDVRQGTLHYIDRAFPDDVCDLPTPVPNVEWTITKLYEHLYELRNLDSPKVARDQAATFMLISHLVADIHQPLHTLGRVNERCMSDHGGNNFCTERTKKGNCKKGKKLHETYDSLYFKDATDLKVESDKLVERQSLLSFKWNGMSECVSKCLDENYAHAPFIYNIEEDTGLSESYKSETMELLGDRVAMAVYRLAMITEEVFGKSECELYWLHYAHSALIGTA